MATADTYHMYSTALLLDREGKIEEAIDTLETMTAFGDPRAVEAHLLLARLYGRSGAGDKALGRVALLLTIAPENVDAHRLKGDILYALDRDRAALSAYRDVLSLDPDDGGTRVRLADLLAAEGDFEGALETLREAERRGGFVPEVSRRHTEILAHRDGAPAALEYLDTLPIQGHPDLQLLHAEQLAALGRNEDAIEAYRALLVPAPDTPRAHETLAGLLEAEGKPEEAVPHWEKAAYLSPRRPGLRLELALALADAQRHDEAHIVLKQLVADYPDHPRFRPALAALAAEMELYDEARAEFREVVRRFPRKVESWAGLAILEGPSSAAGRAVLERGVVLNPESPLLLFLLGAAVRQEGNLERAEALVERALAMGLTDEEVWFELGAIRELDGDLEGAQEAFAEVLALNPENASALNYIGYMYADRDIRLEEALKLIQRACALEPENGYFADSLGWVRYRLGDLEQARADLEKALTLATDDPVIYEHLGDVLRALAAPAAAAAAYRRALEIDPSNQSLLERLNEMEQ